MSRRRGGLWATVGGDLLSLTWRIGCSGFALLVFLAIGLGTYYLVRP